MNILYCEDFSKKFDLILDHCDSCHDDHNEGYSDLLEIEIDEIIYQVCCRMFRHYNEKWQKDNKGQEMKIVKEDENFTYYETEHAIGFVASKNTYFSFRPERLSPEDHFGEATEMISDSLNS